jgi:hypothetical protein
MVEAERTSDKKRRVALQNHKTYLRKRKHSRLQHTRSSSKKHRSSLLHSRQTPHFTCTSYLHQRTQPAVQHLLAHHRPLGHRNRLAQIQAVLALPPQHQRIDKLGGASHQRAADHHVACPAAAAAAEPLAGFGAQFRFERRYGGDTRRRGGCVNIRKHVRRGAIGSSDIREPVHRALTRLLPLLLLLSNDLSVQRRRRLFGTSCWLVIAPSPTNAPPPRVPLLANLTAVDFPIVSSPPPNSPPSSSSSPSPSAPNAGLDPPLPWEQQDWNFGRLRLELLLGHLAQMHNVSLVLPLRGWFGRRRETVPCGCRADSPRSNRRSCSSRRPMRDGEIVRSPNEEIEEYDPEEYIVGVDENGPVLVFGNPEIETDCERIDALMEPGGELVGENASGVER